MCYGCWEEYGCPHIKTDKVMELLPMIEAVYEISCVGGNLHCQLDDWNLDDDMFEEFEVVRDEFSPQEIEIERKCFNLMKSMTEQERASALALWEWFYV